MMIIGCDFHPSFQQLAMLDTETGELVEKRVSVSEAGAFYRSLQGQTVRVGVETSGNMLWLERLLAECGHELWMGDAAKIRAANPQRQKTDRKDARHLLDLLMQDRFPRLWVPRLAERDLRQLLVHRHKLVRMRAQVKNQLQHIALNQGIQWRQKLWTRAGRESLESLELDRWTRLRRDSLLQRLDGFDQEVAELDRFVQQEAESNPRACLLMTHPGVGPVISLATVLTLGDVSRFRNGKKVASYLGLVPREQSSGVRRRLGSITKQGNTFLRHLLVEGGHSAVMAEEKWSRSYLHLARKKQRTGEAKVMVARKLAVRLYWMLRLEKRYPEIVGHAGQLESSCGLKKTGRLCEHPASRSQRGFKRGA
jgi:transposase